MKKEIKQEVKKEVKQKKGMKKTKKIISTLLTGVIVVSALAGCGKTEKNTADNGSSNSKYKDFITVDVFDGQANYQGIQSGWFAKVVKDKFNMELNIIAPNVAGGGDTLFQTRSAAGNLGDLILVAGGNGKLQNLVTSGLVMDMTELIKDKKNLNKYEEAITYTNNLVKEDGIYMIPSEVTELPATTPCEGLDLNFGPYIRWDMYKELGYPQINTLEDLLPVLNDMQAAHPTSDTGKKTYAFSFFKDWDGDYMQNAGQPACLYGYSATGFAMSKADGSDYQSIIDDDSQYVRALKLFFEANQMGLVDPESTTQNYDTLFAKYKDGAVLYSPWPWLGQAAYNTSENKKEGKGFMIAPMEDMEIYSFGCYPKGNAQQNGIMIGSKTKDPERMADFIEWLYSPEGICMSGSQTQGLCGPEGLTWELKDGKTVLTDFGKEALLNGEAVMPEEWGGGSWKDGTSQLNYKSVSPVEINPDNGESYNYSLWDSVTELNSSPLITDWQDKTKAKTTIEYLQNNDKILVSPGTGYVTPEENSEISTLKGQCKSSIVEYSWKMIFAKDQAEFNSLLTQMQETVKGLGYEDVLEIDMKNAKDQQLLRDEIFKLEAEQSK